jgi:hypothetical protein
MKAGKRIHVLGTMSTTRYQIAEYWCQHHDQFVIDLGEPSCFACGFWDSKWDQFSTPEECWNRAKLERAHIVGRSIGGPDTPSNYLLLCPRCHALAPMTNQRDWMLRWAETREKWITRLMREFKEEFRLLGGTDEDTRLVSEIPEAGWRAAWEDLQVDSHPENRCAASSIAVLVLEVARRLEVANRYQPKAA